MKMVKSLSQQLEGGDANSFSNIIIGKNRHGQRKYHGTIDDVYIYNRAINDAEVARLFDGGLEDTDGDGLTDDYEVGKGRYKAIAGKMSWDEAMNDAKSRGGHIATITSEAEWHAIKEELGTIPHGYYLGGTDEKTEGVWEWILVTWKFTKWAKEAIMSTASIRARINFKLGHPLMTVTDFGRQHDDIMWSHGIFLNLVTILIQTPKIAMATA